MCVCEREREKDIHMYVVVLCVFFSIIIIIVLLQLVLAGVLFSAASISCSSSRLSRGSSLVSSILTSFEHVAQLSIQQAPF